MATSKSFKNYVLEQLSPLGNIRARSMMGGYLLYYNEVLFGGLYGENFMIKITPSNESFNLIKEEPYHNAKLMYLMNDIDNSEETIKYVLNAYNDLVGNK